ncbi:hypothetical protein [Ideonella sp.]|jgi:hypothetical protein|uniref:hypothetical protein n=1 Tax=Ideonella sp. TaxID=1929293 RepID=UPI0037C097B5
MTSDQAINKELASAMKQAILVRDLDLAEHYWFQLRQGANVHPRVLAAGVAIHILRGDYLAALHFLDGLPQDACPAFKVIAMKLLGDPLWETDARDLLSHRDVAVQQAMTLLLGAPA